MKTFKKFFAVTLLLFTATVQFANAQSLESQMRSFFSYKNNMAYKLVSKLAHPMNTFRTGNCEMYGNYVYVTINATEKSDNYTIKLKIRKNGPAFDSIEVLEDNDWWDAFDGVDAWKNIGIEFWRSFDPETVSSIEQKYGLITNMNSKQMCLAGLTALLWKYPYGSSVTAPNEISGNKTLKLYGYVGNYPITMSITFRKTYVEGSYYYDRQGPNKVLKLLGNTPDGGGMMLLNETDEYGKNTGRFLGTYSNGVYQGQFHTQQGKQFHFRISTRQNR